MTLKSEEKTQGEESFVLWLVQCAIYSRCRVVGKVATTPAALDKPV